MKEAFQEFESKLCIIIIFSFLTDGKKEEDTIKRIMIFSYCDCCNILLRKRQKYIRIVIYIN